MAHCSATGAHLSPGPESVIALFHSDCVFWLAFHALLDNFAVLNRALGFVMGLSENQTLFERSLDKLELVSIRICFCLFNGPPGMGLECSGVSGRTCKFNLNSIIHCMCCFNTYYCRRFWCGIGCAREQVFRCTSQSVVRVDPTG